MSYESQTWGPMANKKLHIIFVVHIDFIQSLDQNESWFKMKFEFQNVVVHILRHFAYV